MTLRLRMACASDASAIHTIYMQYVGMSVLSQLANIGPYLCYFICFFVFVEKVEFENSIVYLLVG